MHTEWLKLEHNKESFIEMPFVQNLFLSQHSLYYMLVMRFVSDIPWS